MCAMAASITGCPNRKFSPWFIQYPEFEAIIGASGHQTRLNLQEPRHHPGGDHTLVIGALVVCRAQAVLHRAWVLRPNHVDNATPSIRVNCIEDALYVDDAVSLKRTIFASSTINSRKSSDCLNPTRSSIHPILDHSSDQGILAIRPNIGSDRGFVFVPSLVQYTWRADCVRSKPARLPARVRSRGGAGLLP